MKSKEYAWQTNSKESQSQNVGQILFLWKAQIYFLITTSLKNQLWTLHLQQLSIGQTKCLHIGAIANRKCLNTRPLSVAYKVFLTWNSTNERSIILFRRTIFECKKQPNIYCLVSTDFLEVNFTPCFEEKLEHKLERGLAMRVTYDIEEDFWSSPDKFDFITWFVIDKRVNIVG